MGSCFITDYYKYNESCLSVALLVAHRPAKLGEHISCQEQVLPMREHFIALRRESTGLFTAAPRAILEIA